jgi:UDP-N-acetylmuramate: L-alanyl-gamma-D-glutamyl-meso-diaminopimelate ligase
MEIRGEIRGVTVYDDFAHHPTAIQTTLAGLRAKVGEARIIAVLEPRSNTMRLGIHNATLGPSLAAADVVLLYQPAGLDWNLDHVAAALDTAQVFDDIDTLATHIASTAHSGDHVLVMSNGAFGGLHEKLLHLLAMPHNKNT